MSDALLMAVLETLLPGDAGAPPLPPASGVSLDIALLRDHARPLLDRIDTGVFLAADVVARAEMLRGVEQADPAAFRAFLDRALAAYYQAPAVLTAFGWRSAPPMPEGHQLAGNDGLALALLDKVGNRSPLWRR